MNNLYKIFNFLHKIENLKNTLRYNKTTTNRQESTAEHSWRLALMTFIIIDELNLQIDSARAVKIALVHDLAEAIAGDIDAILVLEGKVTKEEKEKSETEAIKKLKDILPSKIGKDISDLWYEYNESKTKEAKFVKALDKIECLSQLIETGYEIYDKPEFIANYADQSVSNFPELKDVLKIVKKKLKIEFEKGGIKWKSEYDEFV